LNATTKAAILAGGAGTRMQRADASAGLEAEQRRAADAGIKGMIPIDRPFLDYVISGLADAGFTDVCLVIGPGHQSIRDYYDSIELRRVRLHFATQPEPRGTADAVLAAESFADGETIVVLNSDNYYPTHTLRALRELGMGGVAAFERDALVRLSNIDADKVARYSIVDIDANGMLERIIEKPGPEFVAQRKGEVFVGMNSWSLPPGIYDACRSITPSARGELELPSAVQYARDRMGEAFRVLTFHDGVLDLSSRADIVAVVAALRMVEPAL
jgi:dTDP-glucose pyrophosphorylase